MNKITILSIALVALASCKNRSHLYDASGTFEAEEIIVSAEATGKILQLNFDEGDSLSANAAVGAIDVIGLQLQKGQIEASLQAVGEKTNDAEPQIAILKAQSQSQQAQIDVLKQQIAVAEKERLRLERLVKADAATPNNSTMPAAKYPFCKNNWQHRRNNSAYSNNKSLPPKPAWRSKTGAF